MINNDTFQWDKLMDRTGPRMRADGGDENDYPGPVGNPAPAPTGSPTPDPAAAPVDPTQAAPVFPTYDITAYGGASAPVNFNPSAAPNFAPPPSFVGPEFTMPDAQTALTEDPGYQFRLNQGLQALENSSAARGVLQTGGTLGSLIDYGQNAASQEYANVYDRRMQKYKTDYQRAMDEYNSQYKTSQDVYESQYNPWLATNQWGNQDALAQYNQGLQAWQAYMQLLLGQQGLLNQATQIAQG